jgi:hypothetical protein
MRIHTSAIKYKFFNRKINRVFSAVPNDELRELINYPGIAEKTL